MEDEELSQWQKDKLVKDDIENLLYGSEEGSNEHKLFNPYSLDSKVSFFEAKFIDGIKDPPKAYKELKSASMPPVISEIEIGTCINGEYDMTIYFKEGENHCSVWVAGRKGKYCIGYNGLIRLLSKLSLFGYWRKIKGGAAYMALVGIDEQFIIDNCIEYK